MSRSLRALAMLLAAAACSTRPADDLSDGVLELPSVLREVSGLCVVDARTVACVQDEVGALFFVDIQGELPVRAVPFGEAADWEGVARVGDAYFVLRSDGYVGRVVSQGGAYRIVASTMLPAGPREWESLCHDEVRGCLLAMPKQGLADGKQARDERAIYAIDVATLEVREEPVLVLSRRGLIDEARARGIALPTRTTERGKVRVDFTFVCSELLAMPVTGEFLVLIARDGAIARLDAAGRLLAVSLIDRDVLPQAEGLALLPDGRLLVASEGVDGPGRFAVVPMP